LVIALLGIDCATIPQKTGLALGELRDGKVHILCCRTGTNSEPPAKIVTDWLHHHDKALIALDAPLGWPRALGTHLHVHSAGLPLQADPDQLFRRATDREIEERLGKRPLEVGANLIARTAVAALKLLDQIRQATSRPIPLAWAPEEEEPWRAIEVYPAATRIGCGARDRGGSLEGLDDLLDCSEVPNLRESKDAVDAAVCALAAADFLCRRAIPPKPEDQETAYSEGWIWAPRAQDPSHRPAD
jgi:predicted nuclease with RNAse H fold